MEDLGRCSQHKTVYLEELRHPQLQLMFPISVMIETDGGTVFASHITTEMYGYGDTESEAVEDLRLGLIDLYEDLFKNSHRLGPLPQQWWTYLQAIIQPVKILL